MNKPQAPSATDVEQTLQRWRAREDELAARSVPVGLPQPDQLAGKSGLQIFEAKIGRASCRERV